MSTATLARPGVLERLAPPKKLLSRRERLAVEEILWREVARDPLNFLGIVKTIDEHAAQNGREAVQAFPVCAICAKDERANADVALLSEPPLQIAVCRAHGKRHKPYFAPLTRNWQADEITIGEKSRQLMISWLYVELFGWLALTRPGTKIAFQSQNEKKACELVDRFALSYKLLPLELQRFGPLVDTPKARARHVEGRIEFVHPGGVKSEIFAIPCGGNQTRMYTFTGIFQDEAQFWEPDEAFEESYAAAIPTIKGGGRLVAISSINSEGSYHARLARGLAA